MPPRHSLLLIPSSLSCHQTATVTHLESTLLQVLVLKDLKLRKINTYKKHRGTGLPAAALSRPPRTELLPYLVTSLATYFLSSPFPCHTSKNSPVSPTIATDPKTLLSKSCICPTSETPGCLLSTSQRYLAYQLLYRDLAVFLLLRELCVLCVLCVKSFFFLRLSTLDWQPLPAVHGSRNTGHLS